MFLPIDNCSEWAASLFSQAKLGDKRLTNRLIKIAEQLSSNAGDSLSKSCNGDEALLEGGYRFLRNDKVKANDIAIAGYDSTAELALDSKLLLAIDDSSSIVYKHEASKLLGYTTNKIDAKSRGFMVHSTILLDAASEKTLGLISQNRWCRAKSDYGKRDSRRTLPYKEKESYKWERNSRDTAARLGKQITNTICICDREADIFEYIQYKLSNNQRFIVRACQNRVLSTNTTLFKHLSSQTKLGAYEIEIAQKANRKKRTVLLELSVSSVSFVPPKRHSNQDEPLKEVTLNVVHAKEITNAPEKALEWILLTTEDINTFDKARQITRYYELRWRIEDFHKAWKSGTKVEKLRMQAEDNLEKMLVILSFVAIRMLQLKEYFEKEPVGEPENTEQQSCEGILSSTQWKVLWATVVKKTLPTKPPSAAWAYSAIAKLGGWTNSKRTGKASWATIWDGWFKLNERVSGFLVAQGILANDL